jgi:hypothetical protein
MTTGLSRLEVNDNKADKPTTWNTYENKIELKI